MATEIKRLDIRRFRGIAETTWYPAAGLNLLLGGGDVGKTTLLEAIGLLLSPSTSHILLDSDYLLRQVEDEFSIEAVMSLPDAVSRQHGMAWPWEWDGQSAVLPAIDLEERVQRLPVYKVRVRGTADLDLIHEIVQPDDTCINFSVTLRREIGLVRLLSDDRNDRDLRLVYGSSLDRLIDDRRLKAKLGRELASDSVDPHLSEEAAARLTQLDTSFSGRNLPSDLGLAITGSAGISINALIGLTAKKEDIALPISTWGSGTRRLAALAIADSLQDGQPITLVDELERGLEPYRQRQLIKQLGELDTQSFVTTHSAAVLNGSSLASAWYVDTSGQLGELPKNKVSRHLTRDPEAFLARLTIITEGATEVGLLEELLDYDFPGWRDVGVYIADGCGNDDALNLLEALSQANIRFGGLVDNEGRHLERWRVLKERAGSLVFQWNHGNLETNIIPMFGPGHVADLIRDPSEEKTGQRLRSLADRLDIQSVVLEDLVAAATARGLQNGGGHPLIPWIIQAATGSVPEHLRDAPADIRNPYKGHASMWFKSIEGGRELGSKVLRLNLLEQYLRPILHDFLEAISEARGQRVGARQA